MPHLLFAPLSSGSSGNAYVLALDREAILIDCGLSAKTILTGLAELGLAPEDVRGVIVTHDHGDHVRGLDVSTHRYGWSVYSRAATLKTCAHYMRRPEFCVPLPETGPFQLGPFSIEAFSIPHDTVDPVAYRIGVGDFRLAVCTDLGKTTPLVQTMLSDLDLLVLEANHDPDMLMEGSYPWHLKQRIRSAFGHLSNVQSGELLAQVVGPRLRHLVLAHLSEENNKPELAQDTVAKLCRLPGHVRLDIALQRVIGPVLEFDLPASGHPTEG